MLLEAKGKEFEKEQEKLKAFNDEWAAMNETAKLQALMPFMPAGFTRQSKRKTASELEGACTKSSKDLSATIADAEDTLAEGLTAESDYDINFL